MKRNDFLSHDWKVGDVLYTIGYKQYSYIKIPVRVVKLTVKDVSPGRWFFVEFNKKEDKNLVDTYGYNMVTAFGVNCSEIFFTKEEAEKKFKKIYNEFRDKHVERVYKALVNRLDSLDKEKNIIWGLMRMKIMKKDKPETV